MKKFKYIPLVLGVLVFGGVVYRLGMWKQPVEVEVEEVIENKVEILEIEYSEENQVMVERESAEGGSVLEFLEDVTEDEKIDLETIRPKLPKEDCKLRQLLMWYPSILEMHS